jgi:hypothetical protein
VPEVVFGEGVVPAFTDDIVTAEVRTKTPINAILLSMVSPCGVVLLSCG